MADRIDGDRAAETMHQIYAICGLARAVELEDVRAAVNAVSRLDAVLPILDPTAYQDLIHNPNSDANRELLSAFSTFRHAVERVAERFPDHMAAEQMR